MFIHNICTITAVHKSWKTSERSHSACNAAGVESQIQTLDYSGSPVEEGEERSEEPEGSETSWEHDPQKQLPRSHGGSESLELVWVWHRFSPLYLYYWVSWYACGIPNSRIRGYLWLFWLLVEYVLLTGLHHKVFIYLFIN